MTENNQYIDEETVNNEINSQTDSSKDIVDDECDSLLVKQKIFDQKVKSILRCCTCGLGALIVIALLVLLYCRVLCGFDEIVNVYKEKGNSDILWFYGASIFSVMLAFLSVALAFINIFAFKKKKNAEQESKDPLAKILSMLTDILDTLKKDKK